MKVGGDDKGGQTGESDRSDRAAMAAGRWLPDLLPESRRDHRKLAAARRIVGSQPDTEQVVRSLPTF
ncbi:MAG TPA: hypothetical protein VHC19_26515 [Pirellulales bacterium]|nr:hypothetical protein [Pirellulales bacterium]